MKKRRSALLLGILMAVSLTMPFAQAEKQVYFLALNNDVQPLSDANMPFWHNGYLYIPGSDFTGTVRKTLGLSYLYVESEQTGLIYSNNGSQHLQFNASYNYAIDQAQRVYFPGCQVRNGQLFLPATLIASFFDLSYSVVNVPHGHLVWLRQKNFGLSEALFADAASYTMERYYTNYINSLVPSTPPTSESTSTPPPIPSRPSTGKHIYLCMLAGTDTLVNLNILNRSDMSATFLCSPEFLEQEDELLRIMAGTGHSIGLLLDAEHPTLSVLEQAEAGNAALQQATHRKTRLVRLNNYDQETADILEAAGYLYLNETLDRSGYQLYNSSHAQNLQQKLNTQQGNVVVWLEDRISTIGLRAFLSLAKEHNHHCLAWTETT